MDGRVETVFDNAVGDLYDGCFILLEGGEGMERGDTNFEIIGAFGVSSWSATFLLVWGVVGLPEEGTLPALLTEEISASRVESRVSISSSDSDSDPVSVISSDPRVSLLKAAQIRSRD